MFYEPTEAEIQDVMAQQRERREQRGAPELGAKWRRALALNWLRLPPAVRAEIQAQDQRAQQNGEIL